MKRLSSLIFLSFLFFIAGCSLFSKQEYAMPKANDYLIEEANVEYLEGDEMGKLIYTFDDHVVYYNDSRDRNTLTFVDREGEILREEIHHTIHNIKSTKSGGFYFAYRESFDGDDIFKLFNSKGDEIYEGGPFHLISDITETESGIIVINYIVDVITENTDEGYKTTMPRNFLCIDEEGNEIHLLEFEDSLDLGGIEYVFTEKDEIIYAFNDPSEREKLYHFYLYKEDSEGELDFEIGPYTIISHLKVSDSGYLYHYYDDQISHLVKIDENGEEIFKRGPYSAINQMIETRQGYLYTIEYLNQKFMLYIDHDGTDLFENQRGPHKRIYKSVELTDGSIVYSYSDDGTDRCLRRLTQDGLIIWTNCNDFKYGMDLVALNGSQFLTWESDRFTRGDDRFVKVFNEDGEVVFEKGPYEDITEVNYFADKEEIFYVSYQEDKGYLNIVDLDGNVILKEELKSHSDGQYYREFYYEDNGKIKVLKILNQRLKKIDFRYN